MNNSTKEYQMLPKCTKQHLSKVENLYLKMYTYSTLILEKNSKYKVNSMLDDCFKLGKKYKYKKSYSASFEEKNMLKEIHQQMKWITSSYKTGVVQFEFQVNERLIIGNSGGNYGNVGIIAIHPTYCVPYIPGSAIKGAFRSYVIHTKYNSDEKVAQRSSYFRDLFGAPDTGKEDYGASQGQKGKVIFLDAFPKSSFTIEQDVQTVHYQTYYNGCSEPTDDISRNPINMYTVAKTNFIISAIFSGECFSEEQIAEMKSFFQETFTEFGIGAKTALGYGLGKIL